MSRRRKQGTPAARSEAVRRARAGEPAEALARSLGVSVATLAGWLAEAAPTPPPPAAPTPPTGEPPRHFVPDGAARPLPALAGPHQPLDLLRVGAERWAVVADAQGALRPVPGKERDRLEAGVRRELNAQERAVPLREVLAGELWLFALHRLEPLQPVPGLDDPVEVCGTLFGPFPGPGQARPGRLTVTRGELLDALLTGTWHPFLFTARAREQRSLTSALLSGGSDEDASAGAGLVLAYPLLAEGLARGDPGNEEEVRGLLHDLLAAVRADQAQEGIGTLPRRPLPVVNRTALEASLEARGFQVQGDRASRPRGGLLGALFPERVQVPPAATLEDLLALTRVALAELPGYPGRRIEAVHRRLRLAEVSWTPGRLGGLWPAAQQSPPLRLVEGRLLSPPARRRVDPARRDAKLEATSRQVGFGMDPAFPLRTQDLVEVDVEYLEPKGPGDLRVVGAGLSTSGEASAPRTFAGRGWTRYTAKLRRLLHPAPEARPFDLAVVVRGAAVQVRRVTVRRLEG